MTKKTKFLGTKNVSFQVLIMATGENRGGGVQEACLRKSSKETSYKIRRQCLQDEGAVGTKVLEEKSTLMGQRSRQVAGMACAD